MRIAENRKEWLARLTAVALIGVAMGGCSSGTTSDSTPTEAAGEPLSPTESAASSTETEPTADMSAASAPTAGADAAANAAELADMIVVTSPTPGETVASPLSVTGEARGNWYFEANFGVRLEDSTGNVIGQGVATAEGEWMTTDFVPFSATIEFAAPYESGPARLVLQRANPADLPANDQELIVPVALE